MSAAPVLALGPLLYRSAQRLFAPGSTPRLASQLSDFLCGWRPDGAVLDIGCADASLLRSLGMAPVGVELAHDRARAFANAIQGDAASLPVRTGAVNLSFCCGLLHHLSDEQAGHALAEMHRVLSRDGRLIIFDAVLPRTLWRKPVAMTIRALDRGMHMRSEEALTQLLGTSLPQLAWRTRRTTYSTTGLEGLWCIAEAAPSCP